MFFLCKEPQPFDQHSLSFSPSSKAMAPKIFKTWQEVLPGEKNDQVQLRKQGLSYKQHARRENHLGGSLTLHPHDHWLTKRSRILEVSTRVKTSRKSRTNHLSQVTKASSKTVRLRSRHQNTPTNHPPNSKNTLKTA